MPVPAVDPLPPTLLVHDASPSAFSSINSRWSAHLQAQPSSPPYAILDRPTGRLSWSQQLQGKAGKGSVLLCLGGEPEWQLVEAAVALGIHLLSNTRSPLLLKTLLFHFDYAASRTGALVLPTCDLLALSIDITAGLLRPSPATTTLTTAFNSPVVGLLDSARESLAVRGSWNHQGVPFPTIDSDVRVQVVWTREDQAVGLPSASLTEPYHAVVSRLSQWTMGTNYTYAERVDGGGTLFGALAALCAAWVGLCSLFSTSSLRAQGRKTTTLPLDLTLAKEDGGGRETLRVRVPQAPDDKSGSTEMVALTQLALLILDGKHGAIEGGVVSPSAALGPKGMMELKRALEEEGGWWWETSA